MPTVRRVLKCVDWLAYAKMEKTLQLTVSHGACQLAWSEKMLIISDAWMSIIFSDKKWNLDGPDDYSTAGETCVYYIRQTNVV